MTSPRPQRPPAEPLRRLFAAFLSPRTAAVTLLSFSSGLPLGLVWIALPDWMRASGVDLRVVGLTTLAQAPWSFKILWAPLMDRPIPRALGGGMLAALGLGGRRRGWIAATQVLLGALIAAAGFAGAPEAVWALLALAFALAIASASHDVVVDAYAVDVLEPAEQSVAVGARTALYRLAMFLSGATTITLAGRTSWKLACLLLALFYLPLLFVTRAAPETRTDAPPRTFREAVWLPFLGFLARRRALQVLGFVLLYKLCDNLSQSLLRPFLVDMGYTADERGIAFGTLGLACTLTGTFVGGLATAPWGLGRCLWIFGVLQILSNLGYILLTYSGRNLPLMLGALGFETFTTGLGMGAFGVLLLRITERRFSATQYALFSSLFALPRILAGPVTGYLVFAFGWRDFFWITIASGIPGLVLLARVVPWSADEPRMTVEPPREGVRPWSRRAIAAVGVAGGIAGAAVAVATMAGMSWLSALGEGEAAPSFARLLRDVVVPGSAVAWLRPAAAVAVAAVAGLLAAAVAAARRGGQLPTANSRDAARDPHP